jgi:hypothetical protein
MTALLLTRVVLPLGGAVALVALTWVLLRRDAPLGAFLAALLAVPLGLIQLCASVRITGWHNLMHSSFVYQIERGGGVPENPLMAGEPLRYYYGQHWLLAQVMRVVPLAPTVLFALFDLLAAILTAVALDRVAVRLGRAKPFRVFAVMMGLAGTLVPSGGLPLKLAQTLGIQVENRAPPVHKFFTANNNPIGIAAAALVLLGLVKLVEGRGRGGRAPGGYALVWFGLLAAGWLYPMSWVPCVAATGVVGLALLAGPGDRRRGVILLALLVACAAAVYPYLRAITAGKSGSSGFAPAGPADLVRGLENLALVLAWPVVVWIVAGRPLGEFLGRNRPVAAVLALWSAVGAALFLVVVAPERIQYKFLATGLLGLGILLGAGLALLYESPRLRPLAFLVPLSVLFGLLRDPAEMIYDWRPSEPIAEVGTRLRHRDPDQDRLYRWIDEQTAPDAVYLDDTLMVPILGRRTLYIGYTRTNNDVDFFNTHQHDGWGVWVHTYLTGVTGVNPSEETSRSALAKGLFAAAAPVDAAGLRRAAEQLGGRPLYLIARDPRMAGRLEGLPFVEPAYRNPAAVVLRVKPGGGSRATPTAEAPGRQPRDRLPAAIDPGARPRS